MRGSWRPKMCQALSLLWKLKQRKSQCQTVAIWVSKHLVWVEDSRNIFREVSCLRHSDVYHYPFLMLLMSFYFFCVHYFDTQTMLIVSHSPTRVSFKWPKIGCIKDRRLAAFFMEVSDSTNESWPQMIPKQQNPTPCYHVWLRKS